MRRTHAAAALGAAIPLLFPAMAAAHITVISSPAVAGAS